MKRAIITGVAVLAAWWGSANFASAQFGVLGQPPIRSHPAVSPFINMGAGGGALNYYGLVRPQTTGNQTLFGLQQGMSRLNPDGSLRSPLQTDNSVSQTGLVTGHPATFFNTGHYFPASPGGGGSGGTPSLNQGFGPLGYGSPYSGGLGGGGLGIGIGVGNQGIGGRDGGIGIIQGIR